MNKWKMLLACGALCATSQFALAGGPEMPPPGHMALYIGVGGAYDYAQYKNALATYILPTFNIIDVMAYEDNNSIFGLSPVGQLGFEYFFGSGGFIGVKGLFNFVDKNSQYLAPGDQLSLSSTSNQGIVEFQSMVQAMLEGGICINSNAFYLEAGYSALFTKSILRNVLTGGLVIGSQNQTLNGGVVGVGYRHYFWDVLSLDVAYSYSIYADASPFNVIDPAIDIERQNVQVFGDSAQLNRVRVQDILFTVNYNFNF